MDVVDFDFALFAPDAQFHLAAAQPVGEAFEQFIHATLFAVDARSATARDFGGRKVDVLITAQSPDQKLFELVQLAQQ